MIQYEAEDPENILMKEREILINRLQSTEKKIQYVRNSQVNDIHCSLKHSSSRRLSVFAFSKVLRLMKCKSGYF